MLNIGEEKKLSKPNLTLSLGFNSENVCKRLELPYRMELQVIPNA